MPRSRRHDQLESPWESAREETSPGRPRLTAMDIVLHLQNILGLPLGEEIRKLVLTEDITTIVVWGVPGSGKTTVVQGIIELLKATDRTTDERRRDIRMIEIQAVSFDTLRQEFLDTLRGRGRNVQALKDLTSHELQEFDDILTAAMTGPLPPPTNSMAKVIRIVEVPAVGDPRFPRGQNGLRILGERARACPNKVQTISIHVLADAPVYHLAQTVREIARRCRDDYQLKAMLSPHVHYLGEPAPSDVRATVWLERFRAMADSGQIMCLLNEFDEQAREANQRYNLYSEQRVNGAPKHKREQIMSVAELMALITRTSTFPPGTEDDRLQIARRFLFVMEQITAWFKFPDTRSSLVAVNTSVSDQTQFLR